MRASRLRTALVAAVAFAAGGFALASCGGSEGTSQTTSDVYDTTATRTTTFETTPSVENPTVVRVVVVNGSPKGGIVRKTVDQDDRVVLAVTSDVADHVHLHGYDIVSAVAAGGTARIRFTATLPGRFEVELEERGVQIADLTVEP